jgi:hypothetical protein
MRRCLWEFLWRGFWCKLLIALICCTALFAVASGVSFGSSRQLSAAGSPNFTLQPVYYDPANPMTKSYFIIDTQKGALLQDQMRVSNVGTAVGMVKLLAADATTGQTGGVVYAPSSQALHDVGSWITLGEQQVTLAPGQSQIVQFQIAVPQDVRPGQHLGGIMAQNMTLQSTTSKNGNTQMHVDVQHQTVIAVQLNVPGAQIEQLVATSIQVGGVDNYQTLLVGLKNTGTTMVSGSGSLQVTDTHGGLLQNVSIQLGTVLPATSLDDPVPVQKKALSAGTYQAELTLHYGRSNVMDQVLYYTTTLTITQQQVKQVFPTGPLQAPLTPPFLPAWALILLAVCAASVIGGASGLLFWRLGRRAAGARKGSRGNH